MIHSAITIIVHNYYSLHCSTYIIYHTLFLLCTLQLRKVNNHNVVQKIQQNQHTLFFTVYACVQTLHS